MNSKKSNIIISIVIPTYNAKKYLLSCVDSIIGSKLKQYEIVIVDNGSTDKTQEEVRTKFHREIKKIRFVSLSRNYGPALARNKGVAVTLGKYVCFLDTDTEVAPNWAQEALRLLEKNPKVGALQCKLLLMKDKKTIDYLGEYLGSLGFMSPLVPYGEKDNGQYDSVQRILAAKSAGMFMRKDVFEKIGGFDDDYFIFMEETDLQWRCWLQGYEVVLCPKSVVYHHFASTKNIVDKDFNNYLTRFHGTKNYILTLFKNLSTKNLLTILPKHVFLWICLSGYLLITGKLKSAQNILKGVAWNVLNLQISLKKRSEIQKNRVASDDDLFIRNGLMKKRGFLFLIKRFKQSQHEVATTENQ